MKRTSRVKAKKSFKTYADNWKEDARLMQLAKCYDWMAERLADIKPQRILDIGAESGLGILALKNSYNATVISLEENPFCIHNSIQNLTAHKLTANPIFRLKLHDKPGLHYQIKPGQITLTDLTLIQADMLTPDLELKQILHKVEKFDAVAVWLIGTSGIKYGHAGLTTPLQYRTAIQQMALEIARGCLRSGGVLHYIDRGSTDEPGEHSEESEEKNLTDFKQIKLETRIYEPGTTKISISTSPEVNITDLHKFV